MQGKLTRKSSNGTTNESEFLTFILTHHYKEVIRVQEILSLLATEGQTVRFRIADPIPPLPQKERTYYAVFSDGYYFLKNEAEIEEIQSSETCDFWDALTSSPSYSRSEAIRYLSLLCQQGVECVEV